MILTLKVGPAYVKRFEKGRAAIAVIAVTVRSWVLSTRIFLPKLCTIAFFFSLARAYREFYYAEKVSRGYTG